MHGQHHLYADWLTHRLVDLLVLVSRDASTSTNKEENRLQRALEKQIHLPVLQESSVLQPRWSCKKTHVGESGCFLLCSPGDNLGGAGCHYCKKKLNKCSNETMTTIDDDYSGDSWMCKGSCPKCVARKSGFGTSVMQESWMPALGHPTKEAGISPTQIYFWDYYTAECKAAGIPKGEIPCPKRAPVMEDRSDQKDAWEVVQTDDRTLQSVIDDSR